MTLGCKLKRFQPVVRGDDDVAGALESEANEHANVRVVVGDQDEGLSGHA